MPSLTLHIVRSPAGIVWDSPTSLARSALASLIKSRSRPIGHVAIEVRGQAGWEMTGMTDIQMRVRRKILFSGMGMSVLFLGFPGRMEDRDALAAEWKRRALDPRYAQLEFTVKEGAVERALQYLREYRERGVHQTYGLPHRPRYAEGAGCSAFAVSVLDVAGVLSVDHYRSWSKTVRVPEALMGPPLYEHRASFLSMLVRKHRWATADEPHRSVHFWDPDAIYDWVAERSSRTPGQTKLCVDATTADVPTDPLFFTDPLPQSHPSIAQL